MKRKDFKHDAVGYIIYCVGTNFYQEKLKIIKVRLVRYAMSGGFIAHDSADETYLVHDSGEIFSTKEEAVEHLKELYNDCIKEVEND